MNSSLATVKPSGGTMRPLARDQPQDRQGFRPETPFLPYPSTGVDHRADNVKDALNRPSAGLRCILAIRLRVDLREACFHEQGSKLSIVIGTKGFATRAAYEAGSKQRA